MLQNMSFNTINMDYYFLQAACSANVTESCNGLGVSDAHVQGTTDCSGGHL